LTSTGCGASRSTAWPVIRDTDSRVPSIGDSTTERDSPKKPRCSASSCLRAIRAPSSTRSVAASSSGSTPSRLAKFIRCTLPGRSVRATTSPARTFWPTTASTVPGSGRRRCLRTSAWPVTVSPGV